MNRSDWQTVLARLGPNDLRRINRLVDLLVTADRAKKETARIMLEAIPKPETTQDARDRTETVIAYLARNRPAA